MQDVCALLGKTFQCQCGKVHRIRTQRILVGEDVIPRIPSVLRDLNLRGKALVLFDETTYEVAGKEVMRVLESSSFSILPGLLKKDGPFPFLEPDEGARSQIGEYLFKQPDFLVAVGSGVINDLAKFVAHRVGIPYVAVATAPSMDGYVSPGAPMLVGGYKVTYDATPPLALFADIGVLSAAPLPLVQAGFADLVGKITANADWVIRRVLFGEDFCEPLWENTASFLRDLGFYAEGIARRDKEAVTVLIWALVWSGLGMEMIGDSRPASGGEHLVAHYLEMMALHRGLHPSLHGLRVGVATCIVWRLFQLFFEKAREGLRCIPQNHFDWDTLKVHFGPLFPFVEEEARKKENLSWPEVNPLLLQGAVEDKLSLFNPFELLRRAGIPTNFRELGFPGKMVRDAFLWARFLRSRVTILDLLAHCGVLEELLDRALQEIE
ncbi:MAG: sn-glycerol-1-phosphate dehydrogenase [Candidatus Caldatribacterium sp.]|nr:sn-glycerol-1-phosphate dehydrogenase [Candidatus Caldatribacterium sp.]